MSKTTTDPAINAIKELGDTVGASFQILEKQNAELAARQDAQEASMKQIAKKHWEQEQIARTVHGTRYRYSGANIAHAFDEETRNFARLLEHAGVGDDKRRGGFSDPAFLAGACQWLLRSLFWQRSRGADVASHAVTERLGRAFNDGETAAMLVTGTTDLGGHWLPDPVASELYRLITDNSVISPVATHVPMTSKTLDLPTEGSSSLSVSWGTEGATNITDSVPASNATNKVVLTAARLNGWAEASIEEIQDSPISIVGWILQKLTEQAGREIDAQCLGEGATAQFTGLRTLSGVGELSGSGVNGVTFPTFQGFVNQMFKARERASRKGAMWFLSPEAMALVAGMRSDSVSASDGAGLPLFQYAAGLPSDISGNILGSPAIVHSVVSASRTYGTGTGLSTIYFGPPSHFVIGDRMGMSWDVSDLPNFRQATVQMRLITRLAIGVDVPAAFSRASNVKTV